jgi:hypothetical protein
VAEKVVSFSIEPRELEIMDAWARELEVSRSRVLREMIYMLADRKPAWSGVFVVWEGPKWKEAV